MYLFTPTGNMRALDQRTHCFYTEHLSQVPHLPIVHKATHYEACCHLCIQGSVCTTGEETEIMSQSLYRTAGSFVPSPLWREGPYLLLWNVNKSSQGRGGEGSKILLSLKCKQLSAGKMSV